MKLKDILARAAKGEDLTDAEKAFLAEYDPDKATNDVAAAARRAAEKKLAEAEKARSALAEQVAEIQAKLDNAADAGKSELEKAQGQIAGLSKKVGELTKQVDAARKEKANMERDQRLASIRTEAGIQFVDGLDHGMLARSFASAFDGVDGLEDENVIKAKVDTWKAMNKAAILDASGHGGGSKPHVGAAGGPASAKNPWKEESFNLTEQAQVLKKSPEEAKRLAADAGKTLEL